MEGIINNKKAAAIRELIEQLLLVKFEIAAGIAITDKDLAALQEALTRNKDSSKSPIIRKGIDYLLEKKSVSERCINALENNLEYYSSMLIKSKSKS